MPQHDHPQPEPRGGTKEFRLTTEILEDLTDGFAVIDCNWRYLYLNRAAEAILGRSRHELIGRDIWSEFPGVIGTSIESAWRLAMDDRVAGHGEAFYPGIGWLEEHAYPSEEGIWIFFQDITERKDQQQALEETKAALEEAVRAANARSEVAERLSNERAANANWLNFLAEMEFAFSSTLDDQEIADALAHSAVPELADAAGVMKLDKCGRVYAVSLALVDGEDEARILEAFREHPLDPDLPVGVPRVLRTGEPEIIPELNFRFLHQLINVERYNDGRGAVDICSGLAVPLIARERTIAALWFASFDAERVYDDHDLARARDLAGRAALAIDNAVLYRGAERAERNARLLAEAGATLAASLDFEASLQNLARLIVPDLADYCLIDILEERGMRRVATAHYDPGLDKLLRSTTRFSPDPDSNPLTEVLREGRARLIPQVSPELRESISQNADHLEVIERLNPGSMMLVPLTARGHTFGMIILAGVEGRRKFDEEDLALAGDLAQRAALMIDNTRLYREAVEANRAKSDFLAVISHELRTPLNAIMGYTGLLEAGVAGPLSPDQSKQLNRIDVSARHLLELIEEVLTYSRMEIGREEIQLRPTDLVSLLREAAARIEPLARNKGLAFELDLPRERLIIRTDSAKLRQIVNNLLSNAVKFTDNGSVGLSARLDDGGLEIVVRDTGIGIAPEEQKRLFEPFWQQERGTTRRVTGTGLGLSVSQRLAALLGGEIEVESSPNAGSTFTLHLPGYRSERDIPALDDL